MFGNQAYTSYRPTVYNKDLTWETTKAFNVGLDFGFLNNRYTASIDFYTRKTEDLLATVTIPAGYNFNKEMLRNVGNVTSKGVEFSFNANVISTENWQWMIGGNATYQHNRITNLNGNNMGQCTRHLLRDMLHIPSICINRFTMLQQVSLLRECMQT